VAAFSGPTVLVRESGTVVFGHGKPMFRGAGPKHVLHASKPLVTRSPTHSSAMRCLLHVQ
jgi:hypothetical protein